MTVPKLDKETIAKILADAAVRRKELDRDLDDRRCMRGKYAPPAGRCLVCGGPVEAKIAFPNDGRIGGPPQQGYVKRWDCAGCGLMYGKCPPGPKETT